MTDAHRANRSAKALADNQMAILDAWIKGQIADPRIRGELFSDQKSLREQSQAFVRELVAATQAGTLEDIASPAFGPVKQAIGNIMEARERLGLTPFENAAAIICFKDFWTPYVQEEYKKEEPESLKRELVAISKLTDTLALMALESAVKKREAVIAQQTAAILEMSTPVIQVWNGVVVVPLIGSLDTERAQRLTDHLLQRIVDTGSPVALLDVTGVPAIDTKSAQHIVEAITAVRLLGADVILTGLRPAIAQTLVHLGIDLKTVVSRSSLASGLRYAFDILNLQVMEKNSTR